MPCVSGRRCLLAIVAVTLLAPWRAQTQPAALRVAAASDLQVVFPELARRFTAATGIAVTPSFGSSGNFFAQIQNGAPFDLFFSADIDYPRQLAKSGHGDGATLYRYATGRIVLWSRTDSGIDLTRGLEVLRDARVRRIAIANPLHAPYGRAAVAALRGAKLYESVNAKLVLGENISQTAQLADTGNADVAIVALSLALGPALRRNGTHVEIATTLHPPIEQAAIVIRGAGNQAAARRFLAFLQTSEARELLRVSGFEPPRER